MANRPVRIREEERGREPEQSGDNVQIAIVYTFSADLTLLLREAPILLQDQYFVKTVRPFIFKEFWSNHASPNG
jgi:hypothetical protein